MTVAIKQPKFSARGTCSYMSSAEVEETFFPFRYPEAKVKLARDICHQCPIFVECHDWSLVFAGPDGVWGATSPEDRRQYHLRTEGADFTW